MKIKLLIISITLCFSGSVLSAPETTNLYNPWTEELLNGASTITSIAFPLKKPKNFGIWIKGTSVIGVPKFTVKYQVSYNSVTANFGDPDRAIWIYGDNTGVGLTDSTINDEIIHIESFSPPCMGWVRIQVIGDAVNPVDSLITCWLNVQ